ncbi:SDR family NAD(P)-dependent oxidoreductase [Nonomuraea muscovyensis]|uniref:NAD(P)-dependent dehydrogenase (Short-subunit alcohol dehydrogenase family) n=1 Tax=Nonomuraea muscovyensis TaxID=1124761 RepID=A0A7X0C824_9ACTN|nr:SDR family NAD(P)-dependent oxidoreductase [Nonomuraea muscovyensis]MBB6350017.1 NAD(P)-dependent dehydrogenase (short-subunit alcohol dehydrogenase family) [Nonomuraea muscovyensis]
MEKLTIAVTGANSGIGLRAAQLLAAGGHRVLALCRDPRRGADAVATMERGELVVVDLADPASVEAAAAAVAARTDRVDVLINNAAVFDQTVREAVITPAGHELFWATNHLGPFRLTALLSPLLAAAPHPRVINVASKGLLTMPRIRIRFGELDRPDWYTPTRAYYHAKLAQIMFTFTLAERGGGRLDAVCVRVPSVRLDPGRVRALPPLLRALYAPKNRLALPAERLGETYARLARGEGPAAGYLDEKLRPVRAPAHAYDPAARERLWNLSEQAAGDPSWAW